MPRAEAREGLPNLLAPLGLLLACAVLPEQTEFRGDHARRSSPTEYITI